ncbi:hypothetical protein [Pseudomonas graminis]|uniref:Uncharacterized protein n=1 Tax=Pseudomonas graminis TaxID=158627 RepID=A0A1C2EF15_9PSED|nr:hypothetical protein [Pseudomonas graminis]OCX25506.1 hypothetical protein BBI10_02130 [Pseudomonas graminis]
MNELTEEEMRRALFGDIGSPAPMPTPAPVEEVAPQVVPTPQVTAAKKKPVSKAFTPRLRVTLRVGNEFEGKMEERIHEADTLSTLLAEQEATRAARKKFRYVEVVSVHPIESN